MSLNGLQMQAVYQLHPEVAFIRGDIAYDINNNEVAYDINAVNQKVTENENAEAAHKQSALAKLTAIGLTADEIAALGVK
jgi:hypothetical protein